MRPQRYTVLLILLVVWSAMLTSEAIQSRIKFKAGASSATVDGGVVRGDRDTYLAGARKGQTLKVKITSVENNAVFQIYAPDGHTLKGAGEGEDAMSFSGTLPQSGDYKIVVGGTRGNCTYHLTVSITN